MHVRVDIGLDFSASADVPAAVAAGQAGYDGLWLVEGQYEPLISLGMIAARTERIELGTAILLAFARNPMTTAVAANDLHLYSRGRFLLGLGSQVKAHITRRFSMPWSEPARRMEEYIQAVRAIWSVWESGQKLDF
jgi:alkanesulfonate monooxygenase SsuD/methylene tetrahydromethanopterin reductase-like flavin-dependent oxidoreductase (luciferase family)